ncbi:MAG: tungstate ABC transporter substrate-binding protein WtpA [Bacteroidales bacterium]
MLKLFYISSLVIVLVSCQSNQIKNNGNDFLQLKIIHAGSMSVPVKIICDSFKNQFSKVEFYTEACGSKQCARNISELNKEYDVFVSADYKVLNQMLIPKYATWNIPFASNEMALVFNDKSKFAGEINSNNWYKILLQTDVSFGRSDPNSDPCGVRAVLTIKLAEKFYKSKGLANKLLSKDLSNIRPKETDLLALLETNTIDYIFLYKSVAMQHHLKFISLPDSINLRNPKLSDLYKSVSVEVNGEKPGEKKIEKGEPMVYGITIPSSSKNKKLAEVFVSYFLTKGLSILKQNGQPTIVPSETSTYNNIPSRLKKYAKPKK